jgi:3-dehydroquinate synthase
MVHFKKYLGNPMANSHHACQICINPKGLEELPQYIKELKKEYSCAVIISDENVFPLFGDAVIAAVNECHLRADTLILPPGEQNKNLITANFCWERLVTLGCDRNTLMIVLGGGVLTDLGGFVASTFMRGIDVIFIPTTLLGMVDAAIGGKNGINLPSGKNMIGTRYHPKLIISDPSCLESLSDHEFRSGLAEVIKYGVIDSHFFVYLEQNVSSILKRQEEKISTIIGRCSEIKTHIIEQEFQGNPQIRNILNYGHTFAHAIEGATDFKIYCHGEAVSIGMSCAALLSLKLGFVDQKFVERQDALCHKMGLPTFMSNKIPLETLMDFIKRDKKHVKGKFCLILPTELGKLSQVDHVGKEMILETLKEKQLVE